MMIKYLKQEITGLILFILSSSSASAGANVTTNLKYGSSWINGNWLQLFLTPLTNIAGNMTYIMFFLIIIGALYIKSKHTIMIYIIGIIFAGTALSLIPKEFQGYVVILIGIAAAVIIYRAAYRNE